MRDVWLDLVPDVQTDLKLIDALTGARRHASREPHARAVMRPKCTSHELREPNQRSAGSSPLDCRQRSRGTSISEVRDKNRPDQAMSAAPRDLHIRGHELSDSSMTPRSMQVPRASGVLQPPENDHDRQHQYPTPVAGEHCPHEADLPPPRTHIRSSGQPAHALRPLFDAIESTGPLLVITRIRRCVPTRAYNQDRRRLSNHSTKVTRKDRPAHRPARRLCRLGVGASSGRPWPERYASADAGPYDPAALPGSCKKHQQSSMVRRTRRRSLGDVAGRLRKVPREGRRFHPNCACIATTATSVDAPPRPFGLCLVQWVSIAGTDRTTSVAAGQSKSTPSRSSSP